MADRPISAKTPIARKAAFSTTKPSSKIEHLVDIIDQCTLAKATADQIGDAFLSYLLSMAIDEARSAMLPKRPSELGDVRDL